MSTLLPYNKLHVFLVFLVCSFLYLIKTKFVLSESIQVYLRLCGITGNVMNTNPKSIIVHFMLNVVFLFVCFLYCIFLTECIFACCCCKCINMIPKKCNVFWSETKVFTILTSFPQSLIFYLHHMSLYTQTEEDTFIMLRDFILFRLDLMRYIFVHFAGLNEFV
ncbi:hypothetical protein NL108_009891 [Boleophthalmus pectinirostris]|nr:hypothetical protein NL108_009891 [Boleophthalmus pectinirostris]